MRYYFAPMEGLTDEAFRRLHCKYFPGMDRYYTPFFSPTVHRALTPKESRELPAAHSIRAKVVPQILTKVPEDFIWMAGQCKELGYEEVNLNLGCPSGTVTAKGKGSGMLRDLESLEKFLDAIFADSVLPISVKTRIGFSDPQEFPAILELLNRYPICELTVHPRVRAQFYKGSIHMDAFRYCMENSKNPICYNGDIRNLSQIRALEAQFPQLQAVMIGRALISDPGMLSPGGTDAKVLEAFMNALMDTYIQIFGSVRNTMFRMKEHWGMLLAKFEGSDKLGKRLRKTTDEAEFRSITAQILHTLPMKPELE